MAAVNPSSAVNIGPGYGARTAPADAGEAMTPGMAVYMPTNGKPLKSANASGKVIGLVTAGSGARATIATGERVTIVYHGIVHGFTGLTPGRVIYLGATPGTLADTGSVKVGYAWDAESIMVMPDIGDVAS